MKFLPFPTARTAKFGNRKTTYNNEIYDSLSEARYAQFLDLSRSAVVPEKRVASWERQVRYDFKHNGVLICSYYMDFRVLYEDGHTEYIDVKSTHTKKDPVYRIKNKLMHAFYNISIQEVEC